VVCRRDARRGAARALWRQLTFSLAVLLVEIPLGIALALSMPAQGWKAVLVMVALSLLIPWNVVGTIWQIFGRADIGLLGATLNAWASTTATPATPPTPG
jgi:glycerol transport system permease protein